MKQNVYSLPGEDASPRASELQGRLRDVSRVAALSAVEAYDEAVDSILDGQQNLVDLSQIEWVSIVTRMNLSLVRDLKTSQVRWARDLLG